MFYVFLTLSILQTITLVWLIVQLKFLFAALNSLQQSTYALIALNEYLIKEKKRVS